MTYIPIRFPGFRWGPGCPEGRIFERAEDVPDGWSDNPNDFTADPLDHDGDGRKGGSGDGLDAAKAELNAARAAYKARFGKKAFPGWRLDEIRKRME